MAESQISQGVHWKNDQRRPVLKGGGLFFYETQLAALPKDMRDLSGSGDFPVNWRVRCHRKNQIGEKKNLSLSPVDGYGPQL